MDIVDTMTRRRINIIKERVLSTKYYWIVQFISYGHPSSLKASFEIE